ncbi:MAG TPA: TetR/AcrR family transcriptional regulator [Acidimicrobiales bacterium]|jgi:AcrR family transcriptional regulator|nr:TetR/AcrR family transcriptional regulator [Acidimicrobiales bacterium]
MAATKEMGKREERRVRHQEVSRTQILDAAEEVFASKGYHEATIKEIAHRAEFSVGAVYSFFEHKDDLFVQIYLRRGAEFMDGMRELMTEVRPPLEQLHTLADYQVDFFRRHPNFGRLYLHTSPVVVGDLETKLDALVADRYAEAMKLQADMFRTGQGEGTIRPGDPAVVARLFSAMVSAFQSTDLGAGSMTVGEFHDFLEGAFRARGS